MPKCLVTVYISNHHPYEKPGMADYAHKPQTGRRQADSERLLVSQPS